MTSVKQLVKELKKKANVTIFCKTFSNALEVYDFQWINGFLTVLIGQVDLDDSGVLVLSQTSEIININYAESLIFRVLFSTELVNHSVSINYY